MYGVCSMMYGVRPAMYGVWSTMHDVMSDTWCMLYVMLYMLRVVWGMMYDV